MADINLSTAVGGGATVQKFTSSVGSTTVDITIASVPLDKTYIVISQTAGANTNRLVSADLTTTTNVRLTTTLVDSDTNVVFYVVTSK